MLCLPLGYGSPLLTVPGSDAVGTGEGWDIRRVGGSWTHCVDVASCATMTPGWGRSRSG